jgi:ligand-binding sensor domain-containing protein
LCALLVVATAVMPVPARALDRLIRHWGEDDGLPVRWVTDVEQDEAGYLWLGTKVGLVRFDGRTFVRWAPETLSEKAHRVAAGSGGALYAAEPQGRLFDLDDRAHPTEVIGPEGDPLRDVVDVAVGRDGSLWVVRGEVVLRRADGVWEQPLLDVIGGLEVPRRVRAGGETDPIVVTTKGIWSLPTEGPPARVWDAPGLADAVRHPDGRMTGVYRDGRVVTFQDGEETEHFRTEGVGVVVASRGAVDWVAVETSLVGIAPGEPPRVIPLPRRHGNPFDLLVDRERSLWVASSRGLLQFPEPDTAGWAEADGLPSDLVDQITPGSRGIWVATRQAAALMTPGPGGWTARPASDLLKPSAVCEDTEGVAWTSGKAAAPRGGGMTGMFVAHLGNDEVRYPIPEGDPAADCVTDTAGRVWLATSRGVYLAGPRGKEPVLLSPPPIETQGSPGLVVDASQHLWWLAAGTACATPTDTLASGDASWGCHSAGPSNVIEDVVRLDDGRVWVATRRSGVLDLTGEGFLPVAGLPLGSRAVNGFASSPRGGIWVFGVGTLARIRPDPDGVKILERPGVASGIPDASPEDLYEDPDGTLWLATLTGVVRVPSSARDTPNTVPPVELVEVRRDGEPVALDDLTVPHRHDHLELTFAALSYRDPARLRYRLRLGQDTEAIPMSAPPFLRFAALPPGEYRVEVEASVDGERWSTPPAVAAFTVVRPWHLRWQVWLAGILAVLALGFAVRLSRT